MIRSPVLGIRMRQASEPSVEEILESIKKVIARDNRAEAARERPRHDAAGDAGVTPRIAAQPAPRGEGKPVSFPADVLDLREVAEQILQEERRHGGGHESWRGTELGDENDAPLLPETTTASMRQSLAALAMMSAPGASPQIVRLGETSLESLVRDLLRPQLADWLDRNLPPMVEKLVAAEIARIVGKKG
jgi:cell pole-organizing protein PopZ